MIEASHGGAQLARLKTTLLDATLRMGRFDEAIALAREILPACSPPTHARYASWLGEVLVAERRYEEAIDWYERAPSTRPTTGALRARRLDPWVRSVVAFHADRKTTRNG